MDHLSKLGEPFPLDDIEWRVSRSGPGSNGIYCFVLAYITARAIQKRLDDVCGPEGWRLEEPRMLDVNGKAAFACGLSILVDLQSGPDWVTKWDVCEPTNIESAKGGWSGAMKRAGAQWGIGRYLYRLDETFAEVSETRPHNSARQWKWARTPKDKGGIEFWWKAPGLPAWALPMEPEHEITDENLHALKQAWREKFAADVTNPGELREGFQRFVVSIAGEFPSSDHTCWTRDALDRCVARIAETTDPNGVTADVPFEE